MIGDAVLRIVISADALASFTRTDLQSSFTADLLFDFSIVFCLKFGFQHQHTGFLVCELITLNLTGDDNSRRNMGDTDCRLCLVDVLSTSTGRMISIDL